MLKTRSTPLPWRTPVVGALVAVVLLVGLTVGASIWLSLVNEQRQAQEQLVRQTHHVSLQIRGRMVETEQLLLLEGHRYAVSTRRFIADMTAAAGQSGAAAGRIAHQRR